MSAVRSCHGWRRVLHPRGCIFAAMVANSPIASAASSIRRHTRPGSHVLVDLDGDDLAGCGALIELDSTLLEVDLVDSTDQDHVRLAGGVDPRDVPSRADNLGNKRCASFVGIGLVLARFRVTLQKVENVLNPICRCRIATMQTGEDVLRLGIASNLVHCPGSTI